MTIACIFFHVTWFFDELYFHYQLAVACYIMLKIYVIQVWW